MSVIAVMPSRGRPSKAWKAIRALRDRATMVGTSIVLVIDADDPQHDRYEALRWPGNMGAEVYITTLRGDETGNLVRATNTVSMRIASEDPDAIIGNLGDDHVCHTTGWDRLVTRALATPGIAYGDDLFQRQELPTAPFISASIVNALGWYFLPLCHHLFVDNAVRDVGVQAGIMHFIPELVIEHRHPLAKKARWDEGYERANGQETVEHDRTAYEAWREDGMRDAVERVRMLQAVAA